MREVDGSTSGLKPSHQKHLKALFRRSSKDQLIAPELARQLCEISQELHRQVGVLLNRAGHVERVVLGEPSRLYLPDIGRARGGQVRFRGLRLVRTELRRQGLTSEDLADLSKLRLDAVVVVDLDAQGGARQVHWAHLMPDPIKKTVNPVSETFASLHAVDEHAMRQVVEAEAEVSRLFARGARDFERDSALLVGVWPAGKKVREQAAESMAELQQLATTAGVRVVESVIQIRRELDPRTLLGAGKIEELTLKCLELGAEAIIFDRDLSPSQLRAVTNSTDLKVLDRTQLILDIFARRATSTDGKLQVELAQLKYTLPRLVEKSTAMSRLTGGIGGQGPGETKLEIHRRRARDRIHRLEDEIDKLSVRRRVRRRQRRISSVPSVSIVGYTNAGKSTLLNAVTNAQVLAEDKLFATLDTTSRRVRFPSEREIVLTDTVGFIRDLPRELVNAFKATLEELEESDLILHVIDASDPRVEEKMTAVNKILATLELNEIPRLVVVNKIDETPPIMVSALRRVTQGVAVSAVTGQGLEQLLDTISAVVFEQRALAQAQALDEIELSHPAPFAPASMRD